MFPEDPWKNIEEAASDIRCMKVRGAGRIARAASGALGDFARDHKGGDRTALIDDLRRAAGILVMTRPSAVSLRNGILLTLSGCEKGGSPEEVRGMVIRGSESFREASLRAVDEIGRIGSDMIGDGSVVLTHCNSSAALSLIGHAYERGSVRSVICTESRPWRQGHITARWLAERGIPVTMIVDSATNHIMTEVDAVVVGADTIASSGEVVNKIGTSLISLAARDRDRPFYVCAETYKFSGEMTEGKKVEIEERDASEVSDPLSPGDLPGVRFRNPVFDVTPPDRISGIVTEKGIIPPSKAGDIVKDMIPHSTFEWL